MAVKLCCCRYWLQFECNFASDCGRFRSFCCATYICDWLRLPFSFSMILIACKKKLNNSEFESGNNDWNKSKMYIMAPLTYKLQQSISATIFFYIINGSLLLAAVGATFTITFTISKNNCRRSTHTWLVFNICCYTVN